MAQVHYQEGRPSLQPAYENAAIICHLSGHSTVSGSTPVASRFPAKDIPQGLKWLRLSAEQGTADAHLLLGMAYLKGSDVLHDLVLADVWLHLAAAKGDKFAISQYERAERQMTPDEIEKARTLTEAWRPRISANRRND